MTTQVGTVKPVALEWLGIGAEAGGPGVIVAPAVTIPADKVEPDEKYTLLKDKAMRGVMGSLFSVIGGTQSAAADFSGPVYMDTIGYILDNLMGDLSTTGTTPTSATTTTVNTVVGATTATVASIAGYSNGSVVQIGTGATAEVVVLSIAPSGSTLTFTNNPLRFTHASASTVAIVTFPYTHTFALLNSVAGSNAQPRTHTVTHYNGLTGTYLAAQYAYWCAESCSFTMDPEKLFMHDTKGISYLQQAAASAPTNSISAVQAFPNWKFGVGIGGPASGGTAIYDVTALSLDIKREVKPAWTAAGQQAPYVIYRNALEVSGKFTEISQNSNAMGEYLNNTQPILQFTATNGLSGANLLTVTFNIQVGSVQTVKLGGSQAFEYESTFEAVDNSTNAGGSGGLSPMSVVLVNAIPTY
jgi:hypothetical protein